MKRQVFIIATLLILRLSVFVLLGVATLVPSAMAQEPQPTWTVYLPLVVKPSTGSAPIITSFTANPASIAPGGTSILSWNVAGATNLSLSPGIGTVTGSSRPVSPAATTEYTLTAANAYGSTSAKTTVTVGGNGNLGGFFIPDIPDIDRPTSHPTVMVDSVGGIHIAFAPDSTTPQDATRPAYYAYCPTNCTSAAAFTITPLGDHVEYANLALDLLGRPHLLLRLRPPSTQIFEYRYGTCQGICTNPAQWLFTTVAYATPRPVGWGEPFSRFFALDHLGHPRFIYFDNGANDQDPHWGAFYSYCDAGCTNAANWSETRLLDDSGASEFALVFGPAGQPRLAYTAYDPNTLQWYVGYAECQQNCATIANWSGLRLVDTVSASVSEFAKLALRVDINGRPRLAIYPGTGAGGSLTPGYLHYLWCSAAACTQNGTWQALDLGLRYRNGEEGVDLALDSQNRLRLAYYAPLAEGYGLYYAWCNSNCETSAQGWQSRLVEPSERVTQELPIPPWPGCPYPQCDPPTPPCTLSAWNNGFRPSLALDMAGHPRIAYDAEHEQGGGCGTFTDTRLTRFAIFNQP